MFYFFGFGEFGFFSETRGARVILRPGFERGSKSRSDPPSPSGHPQPPIFGEDGKFWKFGLKILDFLIKIVIFGGILTFGGYLMLVE